MAQGLAMQTGEIRSGRIVAVMATKLPGRSNAPRSNRTNRFGLARNTGGDSSRVCPGPLTVQAGAPQGSGLVPLTVYYLRARPTTAHCTATYM